MAIPRPSAPRIVGTAFSRTKSSVRSSARFAFPLVWYHVWLICVETCSFARRNCSRPVAPMFSARGGNCCGGSGSSLVRSFSFGFIQNSIVSRGAIAFLHVEPFWCLKRGTEYRRRASHRQAATRFAGTHHKCLRPKQQKLLSGSPCSW